jgi:Pectate lyase superfamily protein
MLWPQNRAFGATGVATPSNWVSASDFGAKFDGKSNDSKAIQSAIDWAHLNAVNVEMPSGIAVLMEPLSLSGRQVNLRGAGMARTLLRAGNPMPMIMEVLDKRDVLVSPFRIEDFTLDGAGQTDRNLAIRYRHNFELRNIISQRAKIGIWEQDSWLGRRFNCRVQDCSVGWRLNGSNHSGQFDGCSFTACRDAHLMVGNQGAAQDGNEALLFSACDIEFGPGVGIDVAKGASAVFDTCYIGEGIASDLVRNRGNLIVRDGFVQFGHSANAVAVRPLAGLALFERTVIGGQKFGDLGHLVDLSPDEVATGANGRVKFDDISGNFMVGGNVALRGDVLAEIDMPNLVPRYGISWSDVVRGGSARTELGTNLPRSARRLVCQSTSSTRAILGFQTTINAEAGIGGEPIYVVIVYRAAKPVDLVVTDPGDPVGQQTSFGTLPATEQLRTFVKVDIRAVISRLSTIELTMAAKPGDYFELHRAGFADGRLAQSKGRGSLANLGLI